MLDSGFCATKALIAFLKYEVCAKALDNKRRYWMPHVKSDGIKKIFEENPVGH